MLDRVRGEGLLGPGRPVVVLYSGGRDSTCLLDLAVRIAGADQVAAMHLNYGLREAAGDDERHCRQLCDALRVGLHVVRPRRPRSGNLQAWARATRYRAATELALEVGADVAAGHTATDQVETVLYRLASSPSRRALLGMRAREGAHPSVIRPLLGFTREQTAAYCVERGLAWREDESNDSDAFARNRIRQRLIPALEAAHPAAQDNVLALIEILRAEARVLDDLVEPELSPGGEIRLARLRELAPALRRVVVQTMADVAVGGFAAGVGRRADDVAAMSDTGTAMLDLPHGVRATAVRGVLRFGRTPPLTGAERPNQRARARAPHKLNP